MPFFSAALIKASVMAKLFPFLRGLPVITTIFLLIKLSSFDCEIDFSNTRYYHYSKNGTKSKYTHLSAILA